MTLRAKLALDCYVGGFLHILLTGPTLLLGMFLARPRTLARCSTVTFMKLLGGGSLAIAYPALLAIKGVSHITCLRLVTTAPIAPFAEALGIFDDIVVVRDGKLLPLLKDSLSVVRRLWCSEALVDLEMHSRLRA